MQGIRPAGAAPLETRNGKCIIPAAGEIRHAAMKVGINENREKEESQTLRTQKAAAPKEWNWVLARALFSFHARTHPAGSSFFHVQGVVLLDLPGDGLHPSPVATLFPFPFSLAFRKGPRLGKTAVGMCARPPSE